MTKCDFCDKEAIHFTWQQISQSCSDHTVDADAATSKHLDYLDSHYIQNVEIDKMLAMDSKKKVKSNE